MAARNSTSKARSGRKKSTRSRQVGFTAARAIPRAVSDAIDVERTRLMTAHTLLSCAAIAMDGEDLSFEGPHYLTVLELSRDLVNEAINNLEPMMLESAVGQDESAEEFSADELAIVPPANHRVREPITTYWTH